MRRPPGGSTIEPPETTAERATRLVCILAIHSLLIGVLATATLQPQVQEILTSLDIRVVEDPPTVELEKPAPLPSRPRPLPPTPQPLVQEAAPPPALLTPTATSPVETSAMVMPPQPPPPETAPAPMVESAPVTPAHFNADYLHNPAPVYPAASRRQGEQGTVVLRVLVSAQGNAQTVMVHHRSGFAGLDEAAAKAVRHWRFVPARRGQENVEGWILVPMVFRLKPASDHP